MPLSRLNRLRAVRSAVRMPRDGPSTRATTSPGAGHRSATVLAARQAGVVAGLDLAATAFRLIDPAIAVTGSAGSTG
jgi:nicotinate-nucleotide pyrophosphorylase (carboxylating)